MTYTWLMVLSSSLLVLCSCLEGIFYAEVPSSFPDDLKTYCFLDERNASSKASCAAQCSVQDKCRLFCFAGSKCLLYSAYLSRHWAGEPSVASSAFRCYTSWGSARDATANASIAHSAGTNADKATDGYFCHDEGRCYHANQQTNPWFYALLHSPKRIVAVRLLVRTNTYYNPELQGVEVRVGNSTEPLSSNHLLATITDNPAHGQAVTLQAETPITGSVVSLQRPIYNVYFVMCGLEIIWE